VAEFNRFLDSHPEIAEQLRRDPSLADNPDFLRNHPALRDYLRDHPGVRDEIRQNADAFMRPEDRLDNRDRETRELAEFTRFMDDHREVAEQLRKDPSLADNRQFVENHPDFERFLQTNPGIRHQLTQDPNAFMQQEEQFNRTQNMQDRDNRQDLAEIDRFLDSHREIAEQIQKDPLLADNRDFVKNHPAFRDFLRDHPQIRDEIRLDPRAFMRQEDRFDASQHRDDRDASNRPMASFGEFLETHQGIRADVTRDPSVVRDREYVQNHPELDGYLNAHPEVRDDMLADPDDFVRGAQQFSVTDKATLGASGTSIGTSTGASTQGSDTTGVSTPTSTSNPKPKQ
jgi:hypothetical protein